MEKVFSIVRQRCGLSQTDQMQNLDVNTTLWSIYMSFILQATVHLGKDYTENLQNTKNKPKKSSRELFQVTERLITDQTEIIGITTIDWPKLMWRRRLCWLTELFSLQLPTPTSFLTQCSVWETSVINLSKPGKIGSNGFWKRVLLLSVLEDSPKDIGRFWGLDPRRNGTEPMSTNLVENGRKLLKAWCSTLSKPDVLYSVLPAL